MEKLPKGTTIYVVIRSVSRSGMTRRMDLFVIKNNEPLFLNVEEYDEYSPSSRSDGHYRVEGCGMDMAFHLVYSLGMVVHKDGYYFGHRII